MNNASTSALEGFLLKHSDTIKTIEGDGYPANTNIDTARNETDRRSIQQAIRTPSGRMQDERIFNVHRMRRQDDGTSLLQTDPMNTLFSTGRPGYSRFNPMAYAEMIMPRFQSAPTQLRLPEQGAGLGDMKDVFAHRHSPRPTVMQRVINHAMGRLMT